MDRVASVSGPRQANGNSALAMFHKETGMNRTLAALTRTTAKVQLTMLALVGLGLATAAWLPPMAVHASGSASSVTALDPDSYVVLDPPGSIDTRAHAITSAGDIVGQYFTADQRSHGFLLTRGVYTTIDPPGSVRTTSAGITCLRPASEHDDDNEQRNGRGDKRPDDWDDPRRCRELAVVGRFDTADGKAHGFVLAAGTVTQIDFPGATFTIATSINASGEIVGRYQSTDGLFHGFTLIDGTFTTIDYPGGISIQAIAINDRGHVAGYYVDAGNRFHGFLLIDGSFTAFDPPDSIATGANGSLIGINSRGEIAGRYTTNDGRTHGFVLKNGRYTTMDIGERFTCNNAINRQGLIVGLFEEPNGRRHGFLTSTQALRQQGMDF
jgi:uncharacterized membrane protein